MSGRRSIGRFTVNSVGLGCMALSNGYGYPPSRDEAVRLLNRALDLGYDLLDTAALYGLGNNELLIGEAIGHRRDEFILASKAGMTDVDGNRAIDGRPSTLKHTLDQSLRRLRTDVIDLYYLHRWDKTVPIEASVGALADMVAAGKIRAIGLSEVSTGTLQRAAKIHPIAAVQNEYSPWTRNVELGLLEATKAMGAALVAFAPLARGMLAGSIQSRQDLPPADLRRNLPRFDPENLASNLSLSARFRTLAEEAGCTPAQLSLGWLLARGDHVVPIPGATSIAHLEENAKAAALDLGERMLKRIDALIEADAVAGARYGPTSLAEVDTENFHQ